MSPGYLRDHSRRVQPGIAVKASRDIGTKTQDATPITQILLFGV